MLFPIPHELKAYRLFSTSVSLADEDALSLKLGLNEIFALLVLSLDNIMCEIHLYDLIVLNIAEVVLKMYLILAPKLKVLSCDLYHF